MVCGKACFKDEQQIMIKNELTQPRESLPANILADLPDFPAFNPEQLMPSIERILQDYKSGVERSLSERQCLAKNLLDCETLPGCAELGVCLQIRKPADLKQRVEKPCVTQKNPG